MTRLAGNGRRLDRQALFSAETIRLRESLIQRCRGRCRGHSNVCSVTTGCEGEERGAAPTSSQWHRVRSAAGPRWGCGLGAGLGAGPLGPRNSARMMAAIATGVRRLAEWFPGEDNNGERLLWDEFLLRRRIARITAREGRDFSNRVVADGRRAAEPTLPPRASLEASSGAAACGCRGWRLERAQDRRQPARASQPAEGAGRRADGQYTRGGWGRPGRQCAMGGQAPTTAAAAQQQQQRSTTARRRSATQRTAASSAKLCS